MNFSKFLILKFTAMKAGIKNLTDITLFVDESYAALSDHELAGLLTIDDQAAFNELYKRYGERLYVIARQRITDAYEAEEIMLDIFCNL